MAPSASHLDHLKDLFSPFGVITVRKMFGGAGLSCDGLFFAFSDDDDVWLKVDDVSREAFESAGLKPFEVEMRGKKGTMSYYKPPDDIYDDEDALRHWVRLALDAAARSKTPVKKKASSKKAVKKKSAVKKKTARKKAR